MASTPEEADLAPGARTLAGGRITPGLRCQTGDATRVAAPGLARGARPLGGGRIRLEAVEVVGAQSAGHVLNGGT